MTPFMTPNMKLFPVQHYECWCFLFTCHSFCLWELSLSNHAPVGSALV